MGNRKACGDNAATAMKSVVVDGHTYDWKVTHRCNGRPRALLCKASKLYVDALIHDQAENPPFISLYASINKMRVVSNPGIAERADKVVRMIVDTYVLPNKSFQEVRAMMESGALDPLRDFSEACHEELSLLSSRALQVEYRRA